MNVIATAKYVRTSPRKIRLVTVAVAKLSPTDAIKALEMMPQRAAKLVIDVIQSALANASNNFKLQSDLLHFKTLEVGEGPTLKRMRARSRGMGAPVLKRSSHIRVVLTDDAVITPKNKSTSGKKSTDQPKKARKLVVDHKTAKPVLEHTAQEQQGL
jgi:large subunit ribosomal protein L22